MRKALSLIALGAIYRLIPHPANAVPMGALALYAGASLPRRWAWLIPVAAMLVSDLALIPLDLAYGRPVMDPSRLLIYGAFALTALMGPLARRPKLSPWLLPALSFAASVLFFLVSNFAAWLDLGAYYPRTFGGLMACYAAGLLMVHRTILADLAGTAVLFGLGSLLERAGKEVPAATATLPTQPAA